MLEGYKLRLCVGVFRRREWRDMEASERTINVVQETRLVEFPIIVAVDAAIGEMIIFVVG